MVLTRSRVREALPAEKPRGIAPDRVPLPSGAPARAVAVLDELRAEPLPTFEQVVADSTPVSSDALRKAFDPAWLPASVGLRSVPLAGIGEQVAEVLAVVADSPDLVGSHTLAMILAPLAAELDAPKPPTFDYQGLTDGVAVITHRDLAAAIDSIAAERVDLRDLDGYTELAGHENAIASIQADIYADRAARNMTEQLVADVADSIAAEVAAL